MTVSNESNRIAVGLISDTHGQLPSQIHAVFKGVQTIVHAGDIGDATILDELRMIAPVVAVRGNMDWGDWSRQLATAEVWTLGGLRIGVVHDQYKLPKDIRKARCRAIISGHTHRALIEESNGVLYVNPGSAGQPRGDRPATVALLHIQGARIDAEIIELERSSR